MAQKRHTETKSYIKKAVTQLLQTESFETLSVSQITRKAGINRGTFYLHYTDKYDMFLSIKEDTLNDLQEILDQSPDKSYQDIIILLQYLKDDFDFFKVISQSSFINFSESIKEFILRILGQEPSFEDWLLDYCKIPFPYALEVYLSSIESIISLWIERDAKESPEELAKIIYKIGSLDQGEILE